jgi:hypothetical protein
MVNKEFLGGNVDQYTNKGRIWEIADRYNKESKKLNGKVTSRNKKFVKQCERVGIL